MLEADNAELISRLAVLQKKHAETIDRVSSYLFFAHFINHIFISGEEKRKIVDCIMILILDMAEFNVMFFS